MSITLLGTCRLTGIHNNNNLHNMINYTHSTKEVIQMIQFLKGEKTIPKPYNQLCFRTAIFENRYIDYQYTYREMFENTTLFVVEICSLKKYIHQGYYMHHLPFDKSWNSFYSFHAPYRAFIENTPPDILKEVIIEKQSDEEIERDILEIQKMLFPRKMIIVSHYNSKQNGEYIPSRNHLIVVVERICKKYEIPYINPTVVLSKYSQEQVIQHDLGHYTDFGMNEFSNYMNQWIENV